MPLVELITSDDLRNRVGQDQFDTFRQGNSTTVDEAIAFASDEVRARLGSRYEQSIVDALTPETISNVTRGHAVSIALRNLTAGVGAPQSITDNAVAAYQWLEDVVKDLTTVTGLLDAGDVTEGALGGGTIRGRAPTERIFDQNADSRRWRFRNQPL